MSSSSSILSPEQMKMLEDRYFNKSGGLGGKSRFVRANRGEFSKAQIDYFFLHHPVINTFYGLGRRRGKKEVQTTRAHFPGHRIHADIMIMGKKTAEKQMDALVTVCCYSLLTFCVPMKSRQPDDIQRAFREVIAEYQKYLPPLGTLVFLTDEDGAFVSHSFKRFIRGMGCRHFILSNSKSKSYLAETRQHRIKVGIRALRRLEMFKTGKRLPWQDVIGKVLRVMNTTPSVALRGYTPLKAAKNPPDFREKVKYSGRPSSVNEMLTKMNQSLAKSDVKVGALTRLRLPRWKRRFEKPSLDLVIQKTLYRVVSLKPPALSGLDRMPYFRLETLDGRPVKCTLRTLKKV